MKYTVLISGPAQKELEAIYEWLVEQTEVHAPLWYNDLLNAILSLDTSPARFPIAPESRSEFDQTRQLLFGSKRHAYRILFIIRDENVFITHIRHASQKQL